MRRVREQVGAICLFSNSNYKIYEETQVSSDKDTARMLSAGASRVFFIEAEDAFIYEAFQSVLTLFQLKTPVICESGGLRNYMKPAIFILLHTKGTEAKEKSKPLFEKADLLLESEMGNFQIPENIVTFENQKWQLNL